MENNKEKMLNLLTDEFTKLNEKTFRVYFMIPDSKGKPNSYLNYIYETAYELKEMGYNVHMLHQEEEFIGVADWMGEKYMELPHHNIEKDKIDVAYSDFLFIPEFYSNVMNSVKKMPCKRVVIAQKFDYITQVIPAGISWFNYDIKDCITLTKGLKNDIEKCFPYVNTRVVSPMIDSNVYNISETPKKLIVNIISKNGEDVNNIVKPFFWKYPMYKWVSFRELKNVTKTTFMEALKESAITVWVDEKTEFGSSAVEAIKCGNILIGKLPERELEWMVNEDGTSYRDNAIWYTNTQDVHDIIAGAVEGFLKDSFPSILFEEMQKMGEKYTKEEFIKNINEVYVDDIFEGRKNETLKKMEGLKNE